MENYFHPNPEARRLKDLLNMWSILAAIVGTLFGFGAGSAGLLEKTFSNAVPVQKVNIQACYDPQPDKRISLKWPDNFTNVPDRRPQLNPGIWGNKGLPATFNASPDSATQFQAMVMNGKTERAYILVRKDVRIPSCKVDELAGPHGVGICPGWNNDAPELTHRGICTLNGYTDLRKVAEIQDNEGKPLEIFWNPFSYNVGCDYRQNENCGPGQRRNINLKDFVYVLKRREAVDPDRTRAGCPVRWDSGATNEEACSHYFDVYMAWDFYEAVKSAPATEDPESPYYFVKQVLENCKEETVFIPATEANLTIPPLYVRTPFFLQNQAIIYALEKIIPGRSNEKTNYLNYIWSRPDLVIPNKTHLLQTNINDNSAPLKICTGGSFIQSLSVFTGQPFSVSSAPTIPPPTIAPLVDCFDPLGNIYFKDSTNKTITFKVYTKPATPQTFYLVKPDDNTKIYVYTTTERDYTTNLRRDPSLQLRVMGMITKNVWTWATPWCKPAIYLYPEKPTDINVKLDVDGKLTVSDPVYNENTGWNVKAYPDGRIQLSDVSNQSSVKNKPTTDNRLLTTEYPYLYYEADVTGVEIPNSGFVYSRDDLPKSLKSLMGRIGFNEKETSDFMNYWLPKLSDKPYYFVTLMPEKVINEKERLTFCHPELAEGSPSDCKKSVTPDTLIRTRFVFEGLDYPLSVAPLANIPTHSRSGFTVTDWGGTLVGESCTDFTIK